MWQSPRTHVCGDTGTTAACLCSKITLVAGYRVPTKRSTSGPVRVKWPETKDQEKNPEDTEASR